MSNNLSFIENIKSILSNVNSDQIELILILFSMVPFSFLFHFISNSKLRLYLSLGLGLFFQYKIYQLDIIPVFITSCICYYMTKFMDRKKQAYYVLGYTLAHGSVYHLIKLFKFYANWKISITFIYMTMICRFSGFSFCYADGEIDDEKLSKDQKNYKINDFTILEYFSYIYFFPGSVIGPFYEFSDFRSFINQEGRYKDLSIFKCFKECMIKLRNCIFFMILFVTLKDHSNPKVFFEEQYKDVSIFYKFLVCNLGIIVKYKYYTGFFLNEAMFAASGISFDGNGFHLIKHINAWEVEKTKNAREFFQNWNVSVYLWLKRYIFMRLLNFFTDKNGKKQAFWPKILTPTIAAFWHGFYPNYYIVFFHFYLSMEMIDGLSKFTNKIIGKIINHPVSLCVGWYIFFFGMNYYYYILVLLDYKETLGYLSGMRYCITIFLIFWFIVVKIGLIIQDFIYSNEKKEEVKITNIGRIEDKLEEKVDKKDADYNNDLIRKKKD